jgi:hypothetical protein
MTWCDGSAAGATRAESQHGWVKENESLVLVAPGLASARREGIEMTPADDGGLQERWRARNCA